MPKVEETLASYLSPESSSSARFPVLPTKPVRTISALVGKAYSVAGQAAACLQTMSLLQAYQAELLANLDEGEGIGPNAVCELRRATDLSLRDMAAPGGHWETFMVNLSSIKRKIKTFLWMHLFFLWLLRRCSYIGCREISGIS